MEELLKNKLMKFEEIRIALKNWGQEISEKYSDYLLAKYSEPINTKEESIFLIDIIFKKKVHLDNYGYVLGLQILQIESSEIKLVVDLSEGDGKITKEKVFIINKETLPIEHKVYEDLYRELIQYKSLLTELIDKEII